MHRLAAVALAVGLVTAQEAAARPSESALYQYRPVLVYDADEEHSARSVGRDAWPTVYGAPGHGLWNDVASVLGFIQSRR